MAEYEERSLDDLTEEPSQHRLEELRAKGTVLQSRELTGTIVLLGVMGAMYVFSSKFIQSYLTLLSDVFTKELSKPPQYSDVHAFTEIASKCGTLLFMTFITVGMVGMFLGALTSIAQSGFLISTEKLMPDFERVNPISGFQRLFSMQSFVEGLKSTIKLAVIITVVYFAIKAQMIMIPNTIAMSSQQVIVYIGQTTSKVFGIVGIMLLATSGMDYFIQWRRFRQQSMMTKQEAKQEMKEREGDPQLKARIRSIQRESARKRMMKAVPKADVIVTNPTHFAIAIVYNPEENMAPKVVAKGADFMAQKIKEIAREHGIPMVENVTLARTLYKYVKVGQMIPRSLYQAVAEVLAYVYRIKGRKPKIQDSQNNNQRPQPRL